jgi:hypothetical protein
MVDAEEEEKDEEGEKITLSWIINRSALRGGGGTDNEAISTRLTSMYDVHPYDKVITICIMPLRCPPNA